MDIMLHLRNTNCSSKRHCASFLVVDFPAARHGSIQIVVHELFRAVARKLDDEKASFRLW